MQSDTGRRRQPDIGMRSAQRWRMMAAVASMMVTMACSRQLQPFDIALPAQVLTVTGAPAVADGRARFREIFCALLARDTANGGDAADGDTYLWRLRDEPREKGSGKIPSHDPARRIVLVPGAFNDCFPELGAPMQTGIVRLKRMGYAIDTIAVEGRSGSKRNAGIIAGRLAEMHHAGAGGLLLIGYSKGTTDILHFLDDYPEMAAMISAVISVSGAVNGSFLADHYAGLYGRWFAGALASRCRPGDQQVLTSLEKKEQMMWLAAHPLPRRIAYFSLATFTERPHVARGLRPGYDMLARIDPRNDGQLLFFDQVIPGSTLLGYANTDHWDIALPVRRLHRFWGRPANLPDFIEFPRDTLLEALVLYAIEQIQRTR